MIKKAYSIKLSKICRAPSRIYIKNIFLLLSDKIEVLKFIIKFECYKFNKVKWEFQYSFDQDIKLFSIVTKQNKNMHTTFIFILTGKVNVMICTLQFIIEEIYVGNDMDLPYTIMSKYKVQVTIYLMEYLFYIIRVV